MNPETLSLALMHFGWEGALIALALAAFLCVMRNARARYLAACAALFGMPVAFLTTYGALLPAAPRVTTTPIPIDLSFLLALDPTTSGAPSAAPTLDPSIALVLLWMTGVGLFYCWRLAGWIAGERLRRTGVCAAPDSWQQRTRALAARLRIARPVALLESSLAETPLTIGVLRPVILMPLGVLAGLPTEQVEAILLHELAHIRRFDYLVNLAQSLIEGLLFYHPAVWWVSRVVRTEREFCCDDAVIAATGDAPSYAHALSTLAHRQAAQTAIAATGGDLRRRISRILGKPPRRTATGPILGLLLVTLCGVLAAWQPEPAPPPRPQAPAAPRPVTQEAPAPKSTQAPRPVITQTERDRRIAEADGRFGKNGERGSQTYRGAVHIILGGPTQIRTSPGVERWAYANTPNGTLIIEFVESDRRGFSQMPVDGGTLVRFMTTDRPDNAALGDGLIDWMENFLRNTSRFSREPAAAAPTTEQQRRQQEERLRRELQSPYQRWLDEEVRWIITPAERAVFSRLPSDPERQQFIEQFWLRRDPTFDTLDNELREEHYRRIAWANDRFTTAGVPGWKTDRGMIYIKYGPPNTEEIVGGPEPTERWFYRAIEGVGQDVMIEFVPGPGGSMRMKLDPDSEQQLVTVPAAGINLFERMRREMEVRKASAR